MAKWSESLSITNIKGELKGKTPTVSLNDLQMSVYKQHYSILGGYSIFFVSDGWSCHVQQSRKVPPPLHLPLTLSQNGNRAHWFVNGQSAKPFTHCIQYVYIRKCIQWPVFVLMSTHISTHPGCTACLGLTKWSCHRQICQSFSVVPEEVKVEHAHIKHLIQF